MSFVRFLVVLLSAAVVLLVVALVQVHGVRADIVALRQHQGFRRRPTASSITQLEDDDMTTLATDIMGEDCKTRTITTTRREDESADVWTARHKEAEDAVIALYGEK